MKDTESISVEELERIYKLSNFCHIKILPNIHGNCGVKSGTNHCLGSNKNVSYLMDYCPWCGRKICPKCKEIGKAMLGLK